MVKPDISAYSLPDVKICESENDVTLKTADFGRQCSVYDLNKVFEKETIAEIDDGAWKGLLTAVIYNWSIADAAVSCYPFTSNC